jgi:hypothetical protein
MLIKVCVRLANIKLIAGLDRWRFFNESVKAAEGAAKIKHIVEKKPIGKRNLDDIRLVFNWLRKLPAFVNMKKQDLENVAQVHLFS